MCARMCARKLAQIRLVYHDTDGLDLLCTLFCPTKRPTHSLADLHVCTACMAYMSRIAVAYTGVVVVVAAKCDDPGKVDTLHCTMSDINCGGRAKKMPQNVPFFYQGARASKL
jgi:hypothetical protein